MLVRRAPAALAGLVLLALAAPSQASPQAPAGPPPGGAAASSGTVVPQLRPLAAYAASGLSPEHAARRLLLDRLALQGVDRSLLDHVDQGATARATSSTSREYVDLLPAGDLDGRGGTDVLEERLTFGKESSLRLVARDGRTGQARWTRAYTSDGFLFALPARVAAQGRPGVLVVEDPLGERGSRTLRLTALDGAGRARWSRTVVHRYPEVAVPQEGLASSSGSSYSGVGLWVDRPLASGFETAVLGEAFVRKSGDVTTASASTAWFDAVHQGTGAVRTLVPTVSSSSGYVSGNLLPDVDGDGKDELAVVEGGDAHRVRVLRAADGKAVWVRDDLPVHSGGYLDAVGPLLGSQVRGRVVDDLAFIGSADPGLVAGLPVRDPFGLPRPDPTAARRGEVVLLHGPDGTTAWSRPGDQFLALLRAGVPALGVVTVDTSSTSTSESVTVTLQAVDAKGGVRWTRAESASASKEEMDEFAFSSGAAFALGDLDGDGGNEIVLFAYAYAESNDKMQSSSHLLRARDGAPLRDQRNGILYGGLTPKNLDRWSARSTAAGAELTVLSGRDGKVLTRAVIAGRGLSIDSAYGAALASTSRHDLLVTATDARRVVVAVVAPDGRSRWTVTRTKGSSATGAVSR